ncbi:MAG: S-layer homology domain-containing protein [Candidatus Gracilibacteria bacterium]|jgi:hypothetical protein
MKKALLALVSLCSLLAVPTALAFTDTSGHTNEAAIDSLYASGVVEGYADGTYRPDSTINRAEFVKILIEAKYPGQSEGTFCFNDVTAAWYAPYICKAKTLGIVDGYDDGSFKPGNLINLAEALKIVLEADGVVICESCYSIWYEPYYWWAAPRGILEKVNTDIAHSVTRGEMAQLMVNMDSYVATDFPEGPSLDTSGSPADITYLFAFAHTEDHINHELSEDRYWNIGGYLEDIMPSYPDSDFTWTIQFQGADAQTVSERNSETGLVDYLEDLSDNGWVEFGYHGHHEPTYLNRPQKDLGETYSYQEAFDAISSWVRCEKDPVYGGCVDESGGGIEAVLNAFGTVELVSGVGLFEGFLMERSGGSDAIHELLPSRVLGFGFSDHGASLSQADYESSRDAILAKLDPTNETDTSIFWLNNTLRMNDGIPGMDIGILDLEKGATSVETVLESLENTGPHVLNTSVVSKWVYAKTGISPTQWAYQYPETPELPSSQINSTSTIASNYAKIKDSLEFLIEKSTNDSKINFVDSDELVSLFTSTDSESLSAEERQNLALWLLNSWRSGPPDWAYDGEDFYTLTESFYALAEGYNSTSSVSLEWMIGPWSADGSANTAGAIDLEDLETWIGSWNGEEIPESFTLSGAEWNPAQVLYALAYATVGKAEGWDISEIQIGQSTPYNSFYPLLEDLGCVDCLDSSWSLKPARFQN